MEEESALSDAANDASAAQLWRTQQLLRKKLALQCSCPSLITQAQALKYARRLYGASTGNDSQCACPRGLAALWNNWPAAQCASHGEYLVRGSSQNVFCCTVLSLWMGVWMMYHCMYGWQEAACIQAAPHSARCLCPCCVYVPSLRSECSTSVISSVKHG